jgi:hypothetical protein
MTAEDFQKWYADNNIPSRSLRSAFEAGAASQGKDLTALQELLATVEAGEIDPKRSVPEFAVMFETFSHVQLPMCVSAFRAYHGSLDAAKALHEAVIDDYNFLMGVDWAEVWLPFGSKLHKFNVANTNPARAWLIAIIKALIAQEVTK